MSYYFPFAVTYSPQSTSCVDTSRVMNSRVALRHNAFQRPVASVRTWKTSYDSVARFDRSIKNFTKTPWHGNPFCITGHLLGIHITGPCAGNSPVPGELPKGQWRGALMFSLICVWINGWVNNREAGDLRRYRAHYDVIVMRSCLEILLPICIYVPPGLARGINKNI